MHFQVYFLWAKGKKQCVGGGGALDLMQVKTSFVSKSSPATSYSLSNMIYFQCTRNNTYSGEALAEDGSRPPEVGGELGEGDPGGAVGATADAIRGDHFSVHTKQFI